MRVCIGSASDVKRRAVEKAFPGWDVDCIEVHSGVGEQPLGKEETEKGARSRADGARASEPTADAWIGIESGMVLQDGSWVDVACVVLIRKEGNQTASVGWSEVFPIPDSSVIVVKSPMPVWSQYKDPHSFITGGKLSRVDLIANAITSLLLRN